jgi:hypothetical protein
VTMPVCYVCVCGTTPDTATRNLEYLRFFRALVPPNLGSYACR